MELSKDTYLYLTKFADDRTILNMLSVNKKFSDERFFEEVMRNKYPFLIKFKKPEEGWKQFFIGIVYCIAKIEETYNIKYYPIAGYNPKEYCNESKEKILNGMMILAAQGGQIDVVRLLIEKGATNFDSAMVDAAQSGQIDIVKLMINKGATYFNKAMALAALSGQIDVVRLLIEKGATTFDYTMKYAARGGHKDIVKLMINKGATTFDYAMKYAARGGHKDIIELMIQHGATDFEKAMELAVAGGHQDIVDYLKSL